MIEKGKFVPGGRSRVVLGKSKVFSKVSNGPVWLYYWLPV